MAGFFDLFRLGNTIGSNAWTSVGLGSWIGLPLEIPLRECLDVAVGSSISTELSSVSTDAMFAAIAYGGVPRFESRCFLKRFSHRLC